MTSVAMHSLMTWHNSPGQFVPGTPSLPRIPARLHADSPAAVVPIVSTNLSGYHTVASPHLRGNQSVPVTPRLAQLRVNHCSSSSPMRAFLVPQSPALPTQAVANGLSKQEEQVVPCMTPESLPIMSPAKPMSAMYQGVMSPAPPRDESSNSSCRPISRATLQRTRQKASGIQVPKRSIQVHKRSIHMKKRLAQPPQPTPNQKSPLMDLFSGDNIFA